MNVNQTKIIYVRVQMDLNVDRMNIYVYARLIQFVIQLNMNVRMELVKNADLNTNVHVTKTNYNVKKMNIINAHVK